MMKSAVGFALIAVSFAGCAVFPGQDASSREYRAQYQRDLRDRHVIPYRDDGDYHGPLQQRNGDHGYDD